MSVSEIKRTIDEDDVALLRAVSVLLSKAQKRQKRAAWLGMSAEKLRLVILRLDSRRPISTLAIEIDEMVSDMKKEISELTDAVRSLERSRSDY